VLKQLFVLQLLRLLLQHWLLQLLLLHVLVIIVLAEQVEPQVKVCWAHATALVLAALLPLLLLHRLSSRQQHERCLHELPFRLHRDRPARS
jgi:hypothetical protein